MDLISYSRIFYLHKTYLECWNRKLKWEIDSVLWWYLFFGWIEKNKIKLKVTYWY